MRISNGYMWMVWSCLVALTAAHAHSKSKVIRTSDWASFWMQHASAVAPPTSMHSSHTIRIEGDNFLLDDQTLHIKSGSLHYFRVPSEYWRDRLQKYKAAGLNSVATYVEWSYHEPEEGQYNFSGDRDLVRFIQLAAEEGLHVLLRPGPYICAERDLGGLPYWLLGKYPKIQLRTSDRDFMNESKIWLDKLFEKIKPLLFGNGGPIILVQVENEYGSFGKDPNYKEQLKEIMLRHVGTDAILYTTDGYDEGFVSGGIIPGTLTTVDFPSGETNMTKAFAALRRYMPTGPLMNSEFYPGWLSLWGKSFQRVDIAPIIQTLRAMMNEQISFNFYMFFGGTNFEYMAGAAAEYRPDLTSYDYDAPLTEAGDPTLKYLAIRNLLEQYDPTIANIPSPEPSPKGAYGKVYFREKVRLFSSRGIVTFGKRYADVSGSMLPTFESLRQRSGMVLYETRVNTSGILHIRHPRDWIYVYIDGKLQGIISRMYHKTNLPVETKTNAKLSLLVENHGRINYGSAKLLHDFKGILSKIQMDGNIIKDKWSVTGFPLETIEPFTDDSDNSVEQSESKDGPVFLDGFLELPEGEQPRDTFLDTTGWGKGYVWVNGHHLGRYWLLPGPQVTLYVPGVWLKPAPAKNYIQVIEFESTPANMAMEFIDHPILDQSKPQTWKFS